MSFLSSALYGESCTTSGDFPDVEGLCQGGILDTLSQGVLDFVRHVGFFEIVRGFTFDIPQA